MNKRKYGTSEVAAKSCKFPVLISFSENHIEEQCLSIKHKT